MKKLFLDTMENFLSLIQEISYLVVTILSLHQNFLLFCLSMSKIFGQGKHQTNYF